MKETEIEKIRQIVSRTDKSGNEKVNMLVDIIESLPTERYEVNFDGNVLAGIEVKNSSIKIYGAMNGYGNAIDLNDISIKEVII